jgi:hypothetical protein
MIRYRSCIAKLLTAAFKGLVIGNSRYHFGGVICPKVECLSLGVPV